MPRRSPYQIGKAHGLTDQARYCHRHNNRRYDSSNANMTYSLGYEEGSRARIRGATPPRDMFDLHAIPTPILRKPARSH